MASADEMTRNLQLQQLESIRGQISPADYASALTQINGGPARFTGYGNSTVGAAVAGTAAGIATLNPGVGLAVAGATKYGLDSANGAAASGGGGPVTDQDYTNPNNYGFGATGTDHSMNAFSPTAQTYANMFAQSKTQAQSAAAPQLQRTSIDFSGGGNYAQPTPSPVAPAAPAPVPGPYPITAQMSGGSWLAPAPPPATPPAPGQSVGASIGQAWAQAMGPGGAAAPAPAPAAAPGRTGVAPTPGAAPPSQSPYGADIGRPAYPAAPPTVAANAPGAAPPMPATYGAGIGDVARSGSAPAGFQPPAGFPRPSVAASPAPSPTMAARPPGAAPPASFGAPPMTAGGVAGELSHMAPPPLTPMTGDQAVARYGEPPRTPSALSAELARAPQPQAPQAPTGGGMFQNPTYLQGQQTRAQQGDYANTLWGDMAGGAPSLAQVQLKQGTDAALQSANALAASGGPGNYAAASRQAAQGAAVAGQQLAGQTAALRAQEYATARGELGTALTSQRAQDLTNQGMSYQNAIAQANLENDQNKTQASLQQNQNALNQQGALAWSGQQMGVLSQDQEAKQHYLDLMAQRYGVDKGIGIQQQGIDNQKTAAWIGAGAAALPYVVKAFQ